MKYFKTQTVLAQGQMTQSTEIAAYQHFIYKTGSTIKTRKKKQSRYTKITYRNETFYLTPHRKINFRITEKYNNVSEGTGWNFRNSINHLPTEMSWNCDKIMLDEVIRKGICST